MAKVKVAAVGAGNRMNAYSEYARIHPEEMEIVAVVEPNDVRREQYSRRFGIPVTACYSAWEDFLSLPKQADALFCVRPIRFIISRQSGLWKKATISCWKNR